jgi:hypothetical protein
VGRLLTATFRLPGLAPFEAIEPISGWCVIGKEPKHHYTLRDFARCVVLSHIAPEITEDTNGVSIKIGGHKLAQLPWFVLGLGNASRLRRLPLCEEFVHLSLAVEIEQEQAGELPCKALIRVPYG